MRFLPRSKGFAADAGEPRANGAPSRPRTDNALGILGRTVLSVFYSEIEVIGLENFPHSGGAIVVGNHNNSLIDAVVMMAILPRMPRFLAASTVWDNKPIVPLLTAAGVVPLFRRQDGRENDGDTAQSLAAAAELLGAGGILAVFPEGKSHNEAALLPMKSGTARIALEAENLHGPLALKIIPVGMMFESKNVFRSRALIEIGAPIDVDAQQADRTSKTEVRTTAAARKLTDRISHGLEAVTPNYDNWQEGRLIEQAADMWLQSQSDSPGKSGIIETANMRKEFRKGYALLRTTHPERIESLAAQVADYMHLLKGAGLRDENVGAAFSQDALFRSSLAALVTLAGRLPITVLGVLFNAIPFYILRLLSQRQDLDKRATWSVFAGLFLFPAFWALAALIIGVMTGMWFGFSAGLISIFAVLIVAPATGLVAIKSGETRKRAFQNLRAWYLLRVRGDMRPKLIAQRTSVIALLSDLWDAAFGKAL